MTNKINLSGLILLTSVCMLASTATAFAEDRVVMTTSKKYVEVSVNFKDGQLISDDIISVDWGDGRKYEGLPNSVTGQIGHTYGDEKLHAIVISSTRIKHLDCGNNQLTSLDVSNCPQLQYLYCHDNQLTSLDVSNCPLLKQLGCRKNQLTSLDVSNCTLLEQLGCGDNRFRSLDVSSCTALWVLHINNSAFLETLSCSANVSVIRENCPLLQIQLPNPAGTISVNMRNSSNGNTVVTPYDFDSGFYIGSDNNFHGTNTNPHAGSLYQFIKIGKVNGLRDVIERDIPRTGWADMVAVTPGCGYIVRYRYAIRNARENSTMWQNRYVRIYVVREILAAAEYEAVLGAEIEYIER
ncbi:MAG: DUF5036 family protein [Prevotellaceae bacterium]|jgi:hypothetical protein|nr:DUF5036 family protein [Prevotellaceae bacterium]